jgi:hypothetical protein
VVGQPCGGDGKLAVSLVLHHAPFGHAGGIEAAALLQLPRAVGAGLQSWQALPGVTSDGVVDVVPRADDALGNRGQGRAFLAVERFGLGACPPGREKLTPPNALTVGDAPVFFKQGTAAEAAGSWYGLLKDGGFPAAWVPGTPGLNGVAVSAPFSGCLTLANPATQRRLTYAAVTSSVAAQFLLFDLLWYNTGLVNNTLTEQLITSPTLPARDINGGTVGEGCMIGIYFTTASTQAAAVATTTIRYTNSAGTPNRTATLVAVAGNQIPATPVVGTIVWFRLEAGDTGVRSIEGITLVTAQTGGAISVFIARPVLAMPCPVANIPNTPYVNPAGIRLFASSALFLAHCAAATTALAVSGTLATSPV